MDTNNKSTNLIILIASSCACAFTCGGLLSYLFLQNYKNDQKQEKTKISSSPKTISSAQTVVLDQHSNVNSNVASWLMGGVIGMGPAGGKSTLCSTFNQKTEIILIDAEEFVSWRQCKNDFAFSPTETVMGSSKRNEQQQQQLENVDVNANFEKHFDMTSLFFRGVVPTTFASLMLEQIVVYNCIDAYSSILAGMFHSGMRDVLSSSLHQDTNQLVDDDDDVVVGGSIVGFVADQSDLDRRIHKRNTSIRFNTGHGGFAWHNQCHLLWKGIAQHFNLPMIASDNGQHQLHPWLLSRTQALRTRERLIHIAHRRHCCHFLFRERQQQGSDGVFCDINYYFTLVEVLPLQWALYRSKSKWPGFDYCSSSSSSSDRSSSSKADDDESEEDFETPLLVSWFHHPYPGGVGRATESKTASKTESESSSTSTPSMNCSTTFEQFYADNPDLFKMQDIRDHSTTTVLVQSPYIVPDWGRAPTPFKFIVICSNKNKIVAVSPGATHPSTLRKVMSSSQQQQKNALRHQVHEIDLITKRRDFATGRIFEVPCGYSSSFIATHHLKQSSTSAAVNSINEGLDFLAKHQTELPPLPSKEQSKSILVKDKKGKESVGGGGGDSGVGSNRRRRCVILYYGSFSPFHSGHRETLILAKKDLEENKNYDVLGAYVVPVARLYPKEEPLESLKSWAVRAAIVQMCVSDLPWCAVDFAQGFPNQCVESVAQRINALFSRNQQKQRKRKEEKDGDDDDQDDDEDDEDPVAVVWVNGSDISVSNYFQYLVKTTSCVDCLFMPRGIKGDESIDREVEQKKKEIEKIFGSDSSQQRRRAHVGDLFPELSLSSTKVRRAIADGEYDSARQMIGNNAAASYCFWASHEMDDNQDRNWPF